MKPEQTLFEEIRTTFCTEYPEVTEGKMMSSPAIHYHSRVFAFYSRKDKMVFKLGKDFPPDPVNGVVEFSPFKTKKPLTGWFEVPFSRHELWPQYTENALEFIKNNP